MDFSTLVLQKLQPLLQRFNLKIVEKVKDGVTISSKQVVITIGYNSREHAGDIFISRPGFLSVEIGLVLEDYFNSDFSLRGDTREEVVDKVDHFFYGIGGSYIAGDSEQLEKLENYYTERIRRYHEKLMAEQNLTSADRAWREQDYLRFIALIDEVPAKFVTVDCRSKYLVAKTIL